MAIDLDLNFNLNQKIHWKDSASHLLLNPKMFEEEKNQLVELFKKYNLPGHIWIASSGSSKKANESVKLIGLSKEAFLVSSAAVNKHLQVSSEDKWIQVLPRFHVGGLSLESRAFLVGINVEDGLDSGVWDPKYFVNKLLETKSTLTSMVPTQIFDLLQAGFVGPKFLRAIVVGGAAMSEDLYQQARRTGWPVLPSFGMTECASQVATAELSSVLSSSGEFPLHKVLGHCQVMLSEDGLLKLKCDSLFTGFAQWVDGKAQWTLADKNDWFTTQDQTEIIQNSNGTYLKSMSRGSDFVKIKGEGISLSKLRETLDALLISNQLGNAKEFALTAISTSQENRDGAVMTLFYSRKSTVNEAQKVMELYNSKVTSIEKIKNLKRISEIPRSGLGKILYTKLV